MRHGDDWHLEQGRNESLELVRRMIRLREGDQWALRRRLQPRHQPLKPAVRGLPAIDAFDRHAEFTEGGSVIKRLACLCRNLSASWAYEDETTEAAVAIGENAAVGRARAVE